jgi:hypothetical protein
VLEGQGADLEGGEEFGRHGFGLKNDSIRILMGSRQDLGGWVSRVCLVSFRVDFKWIADESERA